MRNGRERLRLLAGLNFDHVGHITGIEQLGAENNYREWRGGMEDLLDMRGRFAFPVGTDDQVVACFGASGAAPHVSVIEGIAHRSIAPSSSVAWEQQELRSPRLGAQVYLHQGIGSIAVRGNDCRIFVGKHPRFVVSVPMGALYWDDVLSTTSS